MMDRLKRKRTKQLIALFGIPVVTYTVLDMWIGETFQCIGLSPIIPLLDTPYLKGNDFELMFRGISFAVLLCIWSFPVFLFQKTNNLYIKILSCLLGTIIAVWYAGMSWLSGIFWADSIESWTKQVTDSSSIVLFVCFSILGGIGLFYSSFGFCFYKILKSKESTAIKTDSRNT